MSLLGPRALWIGVGNPATARLAERSRPAAVWVSSYCASAELKGAAEYVFGDDGITSLQYIYDFSAILVKTGVLKVKPAT